MTNKQQQSPFDEWYTREDVQKIFGYGKTQMNLLLKNPKLEVAKIGHRSFIKKESLNNFLDEKSIFFGNQNNHNDYPENTEINEKKQKPTLQMKDHHRLEELESLIEYLGEKASQINLSLSSTEKRISSLEDRFTKLYLNMPVNDNYLKANNLKPKSNKNSFQHVITFISTLIFITLLFGYTKGNFNIIDWEFSQRVYTLFISAIVTVIFSIIIKKKITTNANDYKER